MDEEPRAAVTGPGTTAAEAGPAAQEISEVFRGSAGAVAYKQLTLPTIA
jgi:hypothetical protein